METKTRYPSDLTQQEWEVIAPLIPPSKPGGRPRTTDMRMVVNALFYISRTGCQWRYLPKEFPPRTTVDTYFYQWRNDGTWQQINDALREQVQAKGRSKASAYSRDYRQPVGEDD